MTRDAESEQAPGAPRTVDRDATSSEVADPDRRTTRRAIRAGVRTAAVVAVVTVLGNALFGGDGQTAMVWVLSSVVVGTLVTAGWLILSIILDLVAGEVPGRARLISAGIAFAVAFVSPILPAAMLQVIAEQ